MIPAAQLVVGVIIPAHDEAATVGTVVRIAIASDLGEVLVVSDGSTDATASRAREAGARVLELERNRGKAGAVAEGARVMTADVVLLLDADLTGLRPDHLHDLVRPVLDGSADTTVGLFAGGRGSTDLAQTLTPFLSGQRAIPRSLLLRIEGLERLHYAIELAITRQIEAEGLRLARVQLPGVSQVMKEEKRGILAGLGHRLRMYWQILAFAARPRRSGRSS